MRHALRPQLESLEQKSLLSAVVAHVGEHVRMASGASIPGLTAVLTTNKRIYHAGQPVRMTVTETNTTNHGIQVGLGPSTDSFFVTQGHSTVWTSTGATALFVILRIIPPHKSITITGVWNGKPNSEIAEPDDGLSGKFQVHSFVPKTKPVTITILP